MPTYGVLNDQAAHLAISYRREKAIKFLFLGLPLYGASEVFRSIFENLFGFGWLLRRNAEAGVHLPEVSYRRKGANEAGFTITYNKYSFKENNWLLIGWNYFTRNLGRMVGWALVLPYAIVVNLGIKTYYGIKHAILNYNLHKELKKIEPQDLVKRWLNIKVDHLGENRLAQHVNANDFFTALVKRHCAELVITLKKGVWSPLLPKARYDHYRRAREEVLESERQWWLAVACLSGILVLPLFFTIPAYNNLVIAHEREKVSLSENAELLEKLSSIETKRKLFFYADPKNFKQDLFEYGEIFLKEMVKPRPDLAFHYFSQESKNSKNYKGAMLECGHFLRREKKLVQASRYYLEAQARKTNTHQLKKNPQGIEDLPQSKAEEENDLNLAPSSNHVGLLQIPYRR